MSLDYGLLQTLHRMLRQITDLNDRIRRGPLKVKILSGSQSEAEQVMDECDQRVKELRRISNEKTMQLNEREAKITDMKGKLNTCDSNKEFQLLKDRIAADLQANSVLQDEILEMLERLDVLTDQAKEAKNQFEKAAADTDAMRDKVKTELTELIAEKTRVSGELSETEKRLPRDLMEDYRRLAETKGENAFAISHSDTCDNCNQRLTTQMISNLMLRKLVTCPGCGSIIYVAQ